MLIKCFQQSNMLHVFPPWLSRYGSVALRMASELSIKMQYLQKHKKMNGNCLAIKNISVYMSNKWSM